MVLLPYRKLLRVFALLLFSFVLIYVGMLLGIMSCQEGSKRHVRQKFVDHGRIVSSNHNNDDASISNSESDDDSKNISNPDIPQVIMDDLKPTAGPVAGIPNTTFVYFIIPKCGSRTLFYLVSQLKDRNRWGEVSALTKLVMEKRRDRTKMVQQYVDNATRPAFLYVDTSFVPLGDDPDLVYISLIRNPLERFLSAYYFEKSGDGIKGPDPDAGLKGKYGRDYFSQCQKSHRNDTCFGHWLGKTIHPRFCGVTNLCSQMARKTIERAKRIATQKFAIVGILEEFERFLQLLEKKFPAHFAGIVDLYRDKETREFMSKVKTRQKERPKPEIIEQMMVDMKLDFEFYDHVREHFHEQLGEYGIE